MLKPNDVERQLTQRRLDIEALSRKIASLKVTTNGSSPSVPATLQQIQSDWNQVDPTKVDFIRNKPTSLGVVLVPTSGTMNDDTYVVMTGYNQPHGTCYAFNRCWLGFYGSAGAVAIVDPLSPATFNITSFDNTDSHHYGIIDSSFCTALNRVYFLFHNNGGTGVYVGSLNGATGAREANSLIADAAEPAGQGSLCNDGSYIYVATCKYSSIPILTYYQSYIRKYDISTGALVASQSITYSGLNLLGAHNCRIYNGKIWVSSIAPDAQTDLSFAVIDPTTLSIDYGAKFFAPHAQLTDDSAGDSSYVYYVSELTGSIVKVLNTSPFTFSYVSAGTTAGWCVASDGTDIWVGFSGTDIMKYEPATGAVYKFTSPHTNPNELLFPGGMLFTTFYTAPGAYSVFKTIDATTFKAANLPIF